MRTLAYEGYLIRRSNGVYGLGMEIASRFRDLVASMQRPPQIHEVLRQLAEVTGHTAYFAQLVDGRVVLTDLVEGPHSPHLEDLVVGFDEGAHATALGKALLSTIPATQRKALLEEQGLRPFTSNTITDEGQLLHEITFSARSGIFTEEEQYRPEVCCAAVLIDQAARGRSGSRRGPSGGRSSAGRWCSSSLPRQRPERRRVHRASLSRLSRRRLEPGDAGGEAGQVGREVAVGARRQEHAEHDQQAAGHPLDAGPDAAEPAGQPG